MMQQQTTSTRLDSWKEIAVYLGRDVRTAIRWEQMRGLPVHRLPGNARSAVYAFPVEVDAWLKGQQALDAGLPEDGLDANGSPAADSGAGEQSSVANSRVNVPLMRGRRWAAVAVGLAAVALLALTGRSYFRANAAQPAMATFTTDSVQVWDDHHHLLWEHRFPEPFATTAAVGDIDPVSLLPVPIEGVNRASVHDLYGDGRQEVLAITLFRGADSSANHYRQILSCFSPAGGLLWSYEPQTVLTFGNRTYGAPWVLISFIVSDGPGRKTIWVNASNYVWGKSFIARLDADGHAAIQFVHSGEIAVLERFHTPNGAMLWVGGFNDEYDTASVAILRDTQPFAVSPQTRGSHYACKGCGSGDPFAYFVLPRYDISRIVHNLNNKVYQIDSDASRIEVHQAELSKADQLIYDFSNDGDPRPLRVNYSAGFWANHIELERQGKVNHPLAKCPDRLHPPPVRVYQNGVWREMDVSGR